jgi:tRNA(fMet)-specific endonuclease VapC
MTDQIYLLDTNMITGILKKDARLVDRVTQALSADARLILSPIVYYEIKRGLLRRDAKKQLEFFEQWAETLRWDDLRREDWTLAARLWAVEIGQGRPPQDTDILIAAQAQRLKSILVTANEDHFAHFGLRLENWPAP